MATAADKSRDIAERWLDRIKKREGDCASWFEDAQRVAKRYRNEGEAVRQSDTPRGRRFNVLWANINVMRPLLYAKKPSPVVERKHRDRDAIGRLASQVLERACVVSVEDPTFDDAMKMARDDRLLSARGTVWLQYQPTFGAPTAERLPVREVNGAYQAEGDSKFKPGSDVVEDDMGPFVPGEEYTPVVAERVKIEFVHHRDFMHSDAPSWDLVTWVARRVWMTKRRIAKRFGAACAAHIDTKRQEARAKDDKTPRDTAPIWEIWDKDAGDVIWVCPDYKDGPLDVQPDPLGLSMFFPCPRPVFGTLTPDSMIPVPDYIEYADQARELDLLTDRAYKLIEAIRVAGVYDSNAPGLAQLFNGTAGDKFVAVSNWAVFAEKGGLKSAMDTIDVSGIAQALQVILEVREQVKRDLYEISGIADIMRGDSSASETLGAQQLKAQFGSSRIREPQADMQRFVRDAVQIIAEIICEHFSPEQIAQMSDVSDLLESQFGQDQQAASQAFFAAIDLLKQDTARGYKISIETDSTVELDQQREKADRVEFLTAASSFMEKGAMMAQMTPAMVPLINQMLLWGMRAFRVGRDMEKVFEETLLGIEEQAKQPPAPPPPDPAIEKARMDIEARQAESGMAMQAKQMELQASQGLEQAKLEAQQQLEAAKLRADSDARQMEYQIKSEELGLKVRELELKERDLLMRSQQHEMEMVMRREEADRKAAEDVQKSEGGERGEEAPAHYEAMSRGLEAIGKGQEALAAAISKPKQIQRGPDGRAQGIV